jgi:hypothetical protein
MFPHAPFPESRITSRATDRVARSLPAGRHAIDLETEATCITHV